MNTQNTFPKWMKTVMQLAAIYNLIWGAWVVIFPNHFFELVGMELPKYTTIWQGMGMVIGVYGLGYWWASYNPIRHWPIIAVGLLGKLFGPIGYVFNYFQGNLDGNFGYMLLTNDLPWWIPFFMIMWAVHKSGWKLND